MLLERPVAQLQPSPSHFVRRARSCSDREWVLVRYRSQKSSASPALSGTIRQVQQMNESTQPSVRPSDIAGLIARQHDAVEGKLTELAQIANGLRAGESAAVERAIMLTLTLCDELADHIVIEGRILAPALRDVDAWGDNRADHLTDRLATRQQKIAVLRSACTMPNGSTLADAVSLFIDDRRSAMVRARVRDLSVLRDDIIGIDCSGG